jgi:hypothetical protein
MENSARGHTMIKINTTNKLERNSLVTTSNKCKHQDKIITEDGNMMRIFELNKKYLRLLWKKITDDQWRIRKMLFESRLSN